MSMFVDVADCVDLDFAHVADAVDVVDCVDCDAYFDFDVESDLVDAGVDCAGFV